MTSATRERFYPAAVGVVAFIVSFVIPHPIQLDIAKDLTNPIISILAIIVGFMAAAITILLTVTDLPVMQTFRTGTTFNRMVDYHWEAIVSGMISAFVSLCVIVVCKKIDTWFPIAVFHIWVGLVMWAFTAFFRVVRLLQGLLRN